ncbi:hypothetical protein EYF80_015852 [Liparis tanakae]|uniref:Uncharacterized protein n=1 Tax=Liparis tanakae TaxID=230148 RepID=A0A4Z2I8V0_9TELE|nr:hypothetical protein EYF80_015852 [Liparis tanakae]
MGPDSWVPVPGPDWDANGRRNLQRAEEKLSRDLQRERAMYRACSLSGKSSAEEGMNQTSRRRSSGSSTHRASNPETPFSPTEPHETPFSPTEPHETPFSPTEPN